MEERTKVVEFVRNFFNKNSYLLKVDNDEQREHVESVAVSCICTKHNISYAGGGFAKAVAENDLESAVSRADSIILYNIHAITIVLMNFKNI